MDLLLGPAHEVGVTQTEGLTDAHAGLGEQRQQEPVTGTLWRGQHRNQLLGAQRAWRSAGHGELDPTRRDRAALGEVMEQRLRTRADRR